MPYAALTQVVQGSATCARHGRGWRIGLGTQATLVEHSVGMYHLAVPIANPGTEVPAVELVAGLDAVAPQSARRSMSRQSVLDATAIRRYRQRLTQLDGDSLEREWLLAELALNTGPGGRYRTFADDVERARLAAGRAIRSGDRQRRTGRPADRRAPAGHCPHGDPLLVSSTVDVTAY